MRHQGRLEVVPGRGRHEARDHATQASGACDGIAAPVIRVGEPCPDSELVARAQAGERAAFEALLRRHYERMHRLAWRMTGSRHDADDVVQEVCCALVGKLGGFRHEARFTT